MKDHHPERKFWPLMALAALVGIALALSGADGVPVASAAVFTVSKTVDTNDGACDWDCSMREAIGAANAAPGATISFALPVGTYTLTLMGAPEDANATGDLDITADLTINGTGAGDTIIDGAGIDRVFHVLAGTVTISDVTIKGGNSTGSNSGVGGGIHSVTSGTLTVKGTTISGNTAAYSPGCGCGGGINAGSSGTLIIDSSTISGNTAGYGGGGIFNGGAATLDSSTISDNVVESSGRGGGGIYQAGAMTATNVTVSGNSAGLGGGGGEGGGIFSSGLMTLNSSTVSGNIAGAYGGNIDFLASPITLKNTILANGVAPVGPDCFNPMVSAGHNLIENIADCTISGPATGDIYGFDPLLDVLADNGGPTKTQALQTGSPAIGAGSSDCPPPTTDQRGVPRPPGACDIGAYQVGELSCRSGPGGLVINCIAVDVDPTGNTNANGCASYPCSPGVLGPTENCRAVVSPASSNFDIDIIVDSVPAGGAGFSDMALSYNPAIVNIAAKNIAVALIHQGAGDIPVDFSDSTPDTDGLYRITFGDIQVGGEMGPGIVIRLTIDPIGVGSSPLTLVPNLDSEPVMYDTAGTAYDTDNAGIGNGLIVVGSACPVANLSGQAFCVYGSSTGVGWTWTVAGSQGSFSGSTTVPLGSDASAIAAAWVSSMNGPAPAFGTSGVAASQLSGNQTNCFQITPGGQALTAGTCTVTTSGCNFNPTVFEVASVGGTVALSVKEGDLLVPSLPPVAGAAAMLAALAACGWYARRRLLRR